MMPKTMDIKFIVESQLDTSTKCNFVTIEQQKDLNFFLIDGSNRQIPHQRLTAQVRLELRSVISKLIIFVSCDFPLYPLSHFNQLLRYLGSGCCYCR